MIIVLQRVRRASVKAEGKTAGSIGGGVCLLVGIEKGDRLEDARYLAKKIAELRIFPDSEGKMNLSLLETGGEILAISQFTLAGSVRKGRRPSFDGAERPEPANRMFEEFAGLLRQHGLQVETGVFGALMEVELVNDGPVTFILESKNRKGSGCGDIL